MPEGRSCQGLVRTPTLPTFHLTTRLFYGSHHLHAYLHSLIISYFNLQSIEKSIDQSAQLIAMFSLLFLLTTICVATATNDSKTTSQAAVNVIKNDFINLERITSTNSRS